MIPSNPNPPMSQRDVRRFYSNMYRLLKGDLTPREIALYNTAKETYETIIRNNGGKNPILG